MVVGENREAVRTACLFAAGVAFSLLLAPLAQAQQPKAAAESRTQGRSAARCSGAKPGEP